MIKCRRKRRTCRLIVLGGLIEKEVPSAALLAKLDRTLDRDQDRALFGLPPRSPVDADHSALPASTPLAGWRPARPPMAPGEASTRNPIPRTYLRTSSASPSPSGLALGNPGTQPSPRSSKGLWTASWSALEDSLNERCTRFDRLAEDLPNLESLGPPCEGGRCYNEVGFLAERRGLGSGR